MGNGINSATEPRQERTQSRAPYIGMGGPWWLGVLERLGLPTLLVVLLIWVGHQLYIDARGEIRVFRSEMVESVDGFKAEQQKATFLLERLVDSHD